MQCCSDPKCIFTWTHNDGAPLAAYFVKGDGTDTPPDPLVIISGDTITVTPGHDLSFFDVLHPFPTHTDACLNSRREFAVGVEIDNTNGQFGGTLISIRDFGNEIVDVERDAGGNGLGALVDLVVYSFVPAGAQNVYEIKNVFADLTPRWRHLEIRGDVGTPGKADGWIEVRIDGLVYENGADYAAIDPTDPAPTCPSGRTEIQFLEDPVLGSGPFLGWDRVRWSPSVGSITCLYVKETAAYCNMPNPNAPRRRCPPSGPGGSSFDGRASGPRTPRGSR